MVISLVGLDADDTLWHSENHFVVTEQRFQDLLEPWLQADESAGRLLERERANLRIFGYGIKGFTLSMVETAIEASGGTVSATAIQQIIDWGKDMLDHPVELLPGVADVVGQLAGSCRLALITKGDLFHQEAKIAESGLADFFDEVEILSEKHPENYRRVLDRLGAKPEEFLMVGNSVRSDVLPVLELGAQAAHVPYQVTWGHEQVECERGEWFELASISELPALVARLS